MKNIKLDTMKRGGALLLAGTVLAGCAVQTEPLTVQELNAVAEDRAARVIQKDQEPVTQSIDLYEAMARAIKYNLDHQVEIKQKALRFNEMQLSRRDMVARSGGLGRVYQPR